MPDLFYRKTSKYIYCSSNEQAYINFLKEKCGCKKAFRFFLWPAKYHCIIPNTEETDHCIKELQASHKILLIIF